MKMLKKVILVIIFFSISIALVVIGNGYDMYKSALKEKKQIMQKYKKYHKCI